MAVDGGIGRGVTARRSWGGRLRWPQAIALFICLLVLVGAATWVAFVGPVYVTLTVTDDVDAPRGFDGLPVSTTTGLSIPCPALFGLFDAPGEGLARQLARTSPRDSFLSAYEQAQAEQCGERTRQHATTALLAAGVALVATAAALVLLRGRGPLVVVPRPAPPAGGATPPPPGQPLCTRCGRPRTVRPPTASDTLGTGASLCSGCLAARTAHTAAASLACSIVLLVAGGVMITAGVTDLGATLLAFGLFLPLLYAQVVPHELAHALVGRVLGLRVLAVSVGTGTLLARRDIGMTRFAVQAVPGSGFTALAARSERAYRSRQWCAVVAGPAVSVVVLVLAVRWQPDPTAWAGTLQWVLIASAGAIMFTSLVPHAVAGPLGVAHSDGWQLTRIPRLSREEVAVKVLQDRVATALELARRTGGDPALTATDRDRIHAAAEGAAGAADGAVRSTLLSCLVHLADRQWDAAAAAARRLTATTPPGSIEEVQALNMLAWSLVMAGDVPAGGEADRASARAYQLLPEEPAICGTRGSVLVETGRPAEGLALFDRAVARPRDDVDRALNLAYMAVAHAALGQHDAARRALDEAARLDPSCALLARARSRVTAHPPPA